MKKTTGNIMVTLGCVLVIGLVGGLPSAASHIGDVMAEQGGVTYVFGYVGGQVFAIVASYLLITFGLQLSNGNRKRGEGYGASSLKKRGTAKP